MAEPLIRIQGVSKDFSVTRGLFGRSKMVLRAVSDVSLDILGGETLGLVGESGSGKSTLGRLMLRLLEPTEGRVLYEGRDLSAFGPRELKAFRGQAQIVFQDPFSSFDPRMRVGEIIMEGMPDELDRRRAQDRAAELLGRVGLAATYARRFPHQLSGGERQRVGVARALAVNPRLIVLDEPVSALDVSVQAQILNLLRELHRQLDLTFLLIAHDLRVVKHMADRVAVMYLGRIMEVGPKRAVYEQAAHPYTQALLSAIPALSQAEAERRRRIVLRGEIPSPFQVPSGCRFVTRCPVRMERCQGKVPELAEVSPGHWAACFLLG